MVGRGRRPILWAPKSLEGWGQGSLKPACRCLALCHQTGKAKARLRALAPSPESQPLLWGFTDSVMGDRAVVRKLQRCLPKSVVP